MRAYTTLARRYHALKVSVMLSPAAASPALFPVNTSPASMKRCCRICKINASVLAPVSGTKNALAFWRATQLCGESSYMYICERTERLNSNRKVVVDWFQGSAKTPPSTPAGANNTTASTLGCSGLPWAYELILDLPSLRRRSCGGARPS